jgi:hypothetical protein
MPKKRGLAPPNRHFLMQEYAVGADEAIAANRFAAVKMERDAAFALRYAVVVLDEDTARALGDTSQFLVIAGLAGTVYAIRALA